MQNFNLDFCPWPVGLPPSSHVPTAYQYVLNGVLMYVHFQGPPTGAPYLVCTLIRTLSPSGGDGAFNGFGQAEMVVVSWGRQARLGPSLTVVITSSAPHL